MTTELELSQTPVLDETALGAIRELDEDGGDALLSEILAAYYASCPDLLAQLEDGLTSSSVDKVRMAAHTLKSSSANLGALLLSELCRQAEHAAREGDLTRVQALAPAIWQAYQQTCEALTGTLAR